MLTYLRQFFFLSLAMVLAPPQAIASDVAEALIGISLRASLEATTRAALEESTRETRENDDYAIDYGTRLPEDTAAALHQEAYALDGATLRDVAHRLDVDSLRLALAIQKGVPAQPTVDQLTRMLSLAEPWVR